MLLYMQDYVNLQVALGTKHINSPSVKHRFPSQRSRFYTRGENTFEHSFDVRLLCCW